MTIEPEKLDALVGLPERWFDEELWKKGNLEHLLREHGQRRAYHAIKRWRIENPGDPGPYIVNAHRGFGKTALEVILCWEECLSRPNVTARYAPPDITQGEDILTELFNTFLMVKCPQHMRPHKSGNTWTFQNPRWNDPEAQSRFILVGCKEDADSQRGKRSNFVAMDEIRDIRRPKYVVEDVFAHHFIMKERPFFLITSTPPRTTGHYFSKTLVPQAKAQGAYIEIRGSQNEDFTDDERKKVLKILKIEDQRGIEEAPAYQREIECKLVADRSVMAVPEFYASRHVIRDYTPPSHFFPLEGIDFGHVDYNAAICAIPDYHRGILVLRSEFVANAITTSELAQGVKAAERVAWGLPDGLKHSPRRVADNDIQAIYDLERDYGLSMSAVRKDWKKARWGALNFYRSAVKDGRILIHADCENLIYQHENAEINDKRTDFVRADWADDQDPSTPILGHADALMAVVYLWWMCHDVLTVDPFPPRDLELGEFKVPGEFQDDELPMANVTHETRHITGAIFGDPTEV